MNLPTLILALPLVGFLVALLVPRSSPQRSRMWAIAITLATFATSLALPMVFDRGVPGEQLTLDVPWISTLNIH